MKNRRTMLLLSLFALACVFVLISFLSGSRQGNPLSVFSVPTPTPIQGPQTFTKNPLQLLSTSPVSGATGVGATQEIVMTFNQPVATSSVVFSIFPEITYTISSRLASIIVQPLEKYLENVVYTYSLFTPDGQQLIVATFSSGTAPNPTVPLTGRYPDLDTVADKDQRETYPDVFLENYVPHQESNFSITSEFSSKPTGHYVFTVLPHTDSAKKAATTWMKQLGLTDEQIKKIEIKY